MLIILDRDGVINYDSAEYIKSPEEWIAIPGSLEAIAKLNRAGYQVVVASNQSGVGRGYYSLEMLAKIHKKMEDELASVGGRFENIYFCMHAPEENCECRKPKPGLLKKIIAKYKPDPTKTIFIGDSLRDIQAAHAVSCNPILVLTSKGRATYEKGEGLEGVPVFEDLAAAVEGLLNSKPPINMSEWQIK